MVTKGGMTPRDALIAATKGGPDLMGLSSETGTLDPGKSADLIAVEGDPLVDPTAVQRVDYVMVEGKPIPMKGTMMRSSLFALALALQRARFRRRTRPPATCRRRTPRPTAPKADKDVVKASVEEDAQPVRRSIPLRGQTLAYTVTPGHLTIRNDEGEPTASMFYIAYTVRRRAAAAGHLPVQRRPGLVDHVAAHGLVRPDEGRRVAARKRSPARRSATAPTPTRLLDITDLVFIDAPTTGLSRALGKAEPKDFFGVDKDLDAFTRTIQRYLTKYGRWNSPSSSSAKATARRAPPACRKSLLDQGVQLNGIALRLDRVQLRRLPGRPVADQFPADLCGRRLVPRQDRAQARPLEQFLGRGARLRRRPLCGGAAEGRMRSATRRNSRSRSRWRASPASRADYILRSNLRVSPTASAASCCATATRSSAGSIRAIVGTEPDTAGEGTELRPAGKRDHRRLRRRAQRLSVPRPRLQDAADLPAQQLCRDSASDWNFKHKAPSGDQQIADTSVDLAEAMRAEPAHEDAVGQRLLRPRDAVPRRRI